MHPVNPMQMLCPWGKGPRKESGHCAQGSDHANGDDVLEHRHNSWLGGRFCSAKPSASWVCAVPPFAVSSHCFTESGVQATDLRSTTNSVRNLKNRFHPVQEAWPAEPQSCPTATFWFSGKKISPTIYRTPSLHHFLRLPFSRFLHKHLRNIVQWGSI